MIIMTIYEKIKYEKLQYDINREAVKISTLPSGKIDEYKYLTGKKHFHMLLRVYLLRVYLFFPGKTF